MTEGKESRKDKAVGIALLFTGMALFGSATPVSKLVGQGLPVFTASLLRVLLATVTLFPLVAAGLKQDFRKMDGRAWREAGMISLFGMVGFTVFLIYGMKFVSGVAGSIVMSFTPALTAVGAFFFLGSPLGWRQGVAIAAGLGGLIFINAFRAKFGAGESEHFTLGVVLVLLAISCEAVYTLIGKRATEHMRPLFVTFLASLLSVPLFLVLALVMDLHEADLASVSVKSWLAVLWWGVGTLSAGSALWYSGLSRASGTTAAGFMPVMALSALLLSYFLLGEPFRWMHVPGIVLVLLSIGMMSWVHATTHGDEG